MNPVKTWLCRLVCCGRDDGVVECESWEQADAFREAYTSGVGVALHGYSAPTYESGHRRAVIVTQDDCREAARHIVEHKAEVAALQPAPRGDDAQAGRAVRGGDRDGQAVGGAEGVG